MIRTGLLVAALATSLCAKEIPPDTGVPVSVVITAQGQHNAPAPPLTGNDILVSQDKQHRPITGLEPMRGTTGLQLWVLIDDGSNANLGAQISDLRRFIQSQPSNTEIGIGYLRNGSVEKLQPLTADHDLAARAIRLPSGPPGISASPYLALSELIHKWPAASGAREVLMVSSGIDPIYGSGPSNPYLDQAIHNAQRAGVVVYSIYYPSAGMLGRSNRQIFWGQNYLAQISDETGGALYWLGAAPPPSLTPYLDDLNHRLNGQYLLTFLARPEAKSALQRVEIKAETPHVSLAAPSQVYVPGESAK